MKYWQKFTQKEISEKIFSALGKNVNFYEQNLLGVPASHLDEKVFYQDAPFLNQAPFLSTLIQNPNHIGCHTLGKSESFFSGTQEIEVSLLNICAIDILKSKISEFDGYIASGGTEANIQAIWIYRNYFIKKCKAKLNEICILCSEDTHYSIYKAANLLQLDTSILPVEENTRLLQAGSLHNAISKAKKAGKKYFIAVVNMMTTMFGSVDPIDTFVEELENSECLHKIHVDAAYGGFFYPFSNPDNKLSFKNPRIDSFSLDAHKMAQAPYGTGIFLIRKGFIDYARTAEASYVHGEDYTLIGSRSGANAVAVWMILMKNGPYEWKEKILILLNRANWVSKECEKSGVSYYRNPASNIIAIKASHVNEEIANRYGLVPDNHEKPSWYKIVIMNHVTIDKLLPLMKEISDFNWDKH